MNFKFVQDVNENICDKILGREQRGKQVQTLQQVVSFILQIQKMYRDRIELRPILKSPDVRSNSSGNLLAKRLYRNNSLTKLTPLRNSPSILGSLNTSLIPSISLRKLNKFDYSQPSIQISQGKILLKKQQQLPYMTQQSNLIKKKGAHKKFQKLDNITEKNIVPQELKAEYSSIDISEETTKKWKPSRKWLTKLKQRTQKPEQKLTPQDFIQLIEQQGGLGNEFCYLQKGSHPYDLKIVDFGGAIGDQYITISARGVTYFNWEGSRFVTLQQWRRQAFLFQKLMNLQFFGKYRLHKNFSNWKKYYRKVAMKKTTDKLKSELLVHDRHLRAALLETRGLCCRLQSQINYCYLDDSIPPLPFSKFKTAQQTFLNQRFEKRIGQVEQGIKCQVATCLGVSMREFKEENKISSNKEGKGLPLLIGDQKNLQMPYTKEATLRVQQQKFKRFLKLVELLVVHSKINMMDSATISTSRKLQQQNDAYEQYLAYKSQKPAKDNHFKGKQYIECQLQIKQDEEQVVLKPTRQDLTSLMEDIVNRSIIKLVRNHRRMINDPDINAILYEGAQDQSKQPQPTNILKTILGAQQKQENMVEILNKAVNRSYNYLQNFINNLSPLVVQLFRNQNQLLKISQLNSRDFFTIRQWIEVWRKELQQTSKLNDEHESAVFILNFKNIKEMTIQSTNLCISKVKEMVPKILQQGLRKQQKDLTDALRLMEVAPIGIEIYIGFQNNKNAITNKMDQYDETLCDIGQLIDIMKDLGGPGENMVVRSQKQRKELSQMLKSLRAKMEQAQMHNKVHQSYAQQEVRKMIPKVFASLQNLYNKTKQLRLQASDMMQKIEQIEKQYDNINMQLKKMREYQKFLGMAEISEEKVQKFAAYFKVFKSIWSFKFQADNYQQQFLRSCWKSLCLEDVKYNLDNLLEKAQSIKKCIAKESSEESYQIQYTDLNMINQAVLDIKKKIKPVLQAIQCLRVSSLEERQLRIIRTEFQNKNKRRLAQLTNENDVIIITLLKEGLIQELDFLKKIVFKSKKQLQLNSKMTAVSRFWGDSGINSSKGLIDNFAQHYWTIAAEIDQKITVINCVRQDPEVQQGQFRLRVQNQKNLFDSLRLLLTQWEKHHNFLSYFQPIFANPYWKGTSQYRDYTVAESNWKKLTKQITKDFSLRKLASQQKKHFSILRQNNIIFQELKHSVELFLNAKRQAFPKLNFISNEQLLHLLLQDKDYASIDKHLSRIFPNLKSLELNEERNCPLAVRNMMNEVLTLRISPAKQLLELEQGLKVIEDRIKQALKSGMLKCYNYYFQDDFNRKLWIKENVLQVLLFIGNSQFTKLLEYDYLSLDGQDLNQLLSYQITLIKQLFIMIKEEYQTNSYINDKLGVLLMQAAHFRDIILKLIQDNVRDDNSYQWQRQVRSYYTGNDFAVTKYLNRAVEYGYQFVCPNYSYAISTLSQKYFIELINTISLQYLPILIQKNDLISNFCISNAKNYFSVTLQPKLSSSYMHNLCQGALVSNTFLQFKEAQQINEQTVSLISSFLFESRCMLQKKEAFHLITGGKGTPLPSFNIALRLSPNGQIKTISQKIKINYRVITVPEIPISVYLSFVSNILMQSKQNEIGLKLEKVYQVVNKCSGYDLLNFQDMKAIILQALSFEVEQIRNNLYKGIVKQINNKVCQQDELKFLQRLVKQILLQQKQQEHTKFKSRIEKDNRNIINIVDILSKKQCCIVVGPIYNGKKHFLMESYRTSGIGPVEIYNIDFITYEQFLGCFENDLWKQGILTQHLKQLSYSQQQWLVFEGQMSSLTQNLIKSVARGFLLLQNGQILYLSNNWKFIISTEIILNDKNIPKVCQIIYSESFSVPQEQLHYQLETVIRPYFKTNIEGFSILKNMTVNHFQKILRFRLKGRFLKTDHLINNFIKILECIVSKCPQKNLQLKESQVGLQKMLVWCIYWTFYPTLTTENGKKFQNQFFQQIKIQSDRSLSLNISKFQLDNPSGSYKKIEPVTVTIDNNPYHVTAQREAILKFIEQYLQKNRNILLLGEKNSGKTQFMSYIKQNLGEEFYSFLSIKINQFMSFEKLEQLLYRKAKVIVNQNKQKFLSSINGKQLIVFLDDVNLLDEKTNVGRFFKSLLTLGYYFDHVTHEKIHLNNVSIVAAQNSMFQFNLSYEFIKNFQPLYLQELNIRETVENYSALLTTQLSPQICHNVASLHEFALNFLQNKYKVYPSNIQIPLRILKTLRNYNGRQNLVRVWQYVSLKEYTTNFPQNQSFNSKIIAQIKNYSNLMLKNNQEPINVLQNKEAFLQNLKQNYPILLIDKSKQDYYEYVVMKLQLSKPATIFTINEPICPSIKEQILQFICQLNDIELLHPYMSHEIMYKGQISNKVAIYVSNLDQNFDEILEFMMAENKTTYFYIIDFDSAESWEKCINKYPCLTHYGSRYIKKKHQQTQSLIEGDKQLDKYYKLFEARGKMIKKYQIQEIHRLVEKNVIKINSKCNKDIKMLQQILSRFYQIKKQSQIIEKQLQEHRNQLQKLSKDEEIFRRQLFQLKNSYKSDQTQKQKNSKNIKIQQIQSKLNEIMALKRSSQDQSRAKQDECLSQKKVLTSMSFVYQKVTHLYTNFQIVLKNQRDFAYFFSFIQYFFLKKDFEAIVAIQEICSELPLNFGEITKCLFGMQLTIQEQGTVVWLLNDKSTILYDQYGKFPLQISKKYQKCQIISSAKDLQDLNKFQPDTAYFIVGQLRNESIFLNDMNNMANDKDFRERNRAKDEMKDGKQQKSNKQSKEEKPDYKKNIYFIIKDKQKEEKKETVQILNSNISIRSRQGRQESVIHQVKIQRRQIKQVTIPPNSNILSPAAVIPSKKQEKSKLISNLKQEMKLKIKRRENKDNEGYSKVENEIHDFLTINLENRVFYYGGKKIASIYDQYNKLLPNVTLICKKPLVRTHREEIKKYHELQVDDSTNFINQFFEECQPFLTGALKSQQQQLQKLKSKKQLHYNIIIEKMRQNKPRGLSDIAKKDGDFINSLSENITNMEQKVKKSMLLRSQPYLQYFQLALGLWRYLKKIVSLDQRFRINKQNYKKLVIKNIKFNQSYQKDGQMFEPEFKVDIKTSKEQLMSEVIKYVITSMSYRKGLFALCLLTIMLEEINKFNSSNCYSDKFSFIIKNQEIEVSKLSSNFYHFEESKEIQKLFSLYKTSPGAFIQQCHLYILQKLNLNYQLNFNSIKQQWIHLPQNFLVICNEGANAFESLTNERRSLFVNQYSDFSKCLQSMMQKNSNKLVLINFVKEQSYTKILNIVGQCPQDSRINLVSLFTSKEFYQKAQFKQKISELRVIQLQRSNLPNLQLEGVLQLNFKDNLPQQLQKILKLVLLNQIQFYFKQKIEAGKLGIYTENACFYESDFAHALVSYLGIKQAKTLLEILSQTIYLGRQKYLIKQSRKFMKKDQGESLYKTFIGQAIPNNEQYQFQQQNFVNLDFSELIERMRSVSYCEQLVKMIMPSNLKNEVTKELLYGYKINKKIKKQQNQKREIRWDVIQNMSFESFKNLQSIKLKREMDIYKYQIRKENSKTYLKYRWIEHRLRALKQANSQSLLSANTKGLLLQLSYKQCLWGFTQNIQSVLLSLQKKINHLQQKYLNSSPFKKMHLDFWQNPYQIIYLYLYSSPKKGNIANMQVQCRILNEKQQKSERGWIFETIQLKNCKLDLAKNMLQINQRNENKKLMNLVIVLHEKQPLTGLVYALPLLWRSKEYFKIELQCKFKQDGNPWKQKIVGIIKIQQP